MSEIRLPNVDLTKANLLFAKLENGLYQPVWQEGTPEGAAKVSVASSAIPVANTQYAPLIGSNGNLQLLPSGSNRGPDTFIVDLAAFSSSDIYLVVICATGTVTHKADVQYSMDGTGTYLHPATPDPLWAATAGNLSAALPKKDRFAHITLEQTGVDPAEAIWAYVVGRDVA